MGSLSRTNLRPNWPDGVILTTHVWAGQMTLWLLTHTLLPVQREIPNAFQCWRTCWVKWDISQSKTSLRIYRGKGCCYYNFSTRVDEVVMKSVSWTRVNVWMMFIVCWSILPSGYCPNLKVISKRGDWWRFVTLNPVAFSQPPPPTFSTPPAQAGNNPVPP